jgi:hypothetical protein
MEDHGQDTPFTASNTIIFCLKSYHVINFISKSSEKVSPVVSFHGHNHLTPTQQSLANSVADSPFTNL